MSAVRPEKPKENLDSVAEARQTAGEKRAFDVLMEAQHYWNEMDSFRHDRERCKQYTFGNQWDDTITVNGHPMSEEQYILSQGNVPLKNNLIRRLVRNVLGVYRSQSKEPTCIARDRDEQRFSETMTTMLQCNMQKNKMDEVNSRTMEDFLIGGFVIHKKSYGWRNGQEDCWTDIVNPNNFFIDNNSRDVRGWDVRCLGEVHDISFGQLAEQFASSPEDYQRLREIYRYADRRDYLASTAERFGYSRLQNFDFLFASQPGRCRVIEVWRKEQKPRFRCHDYQTGDVYKIDPEDYQAEVVAENERRTQMALQAGLPEEETALIKAEWFIDNYWYYYYLSPFGHILREGETPYKHGSHPYVFKAYPFIDGEIHSFVADVIDQQRYTNRLITLYDWIMRASAKGVLLMPEDCLPEGTSIEDIAESWTEFNGIVVYKPSKTGQVPHQVANNSTNIGIQELLGLQLKFFEDISGVQGALQGKPGFSGESASHYNAQTQNATMSLLDLLEAFSSFVVDGAYKNVKNIQQFYDKRRVFNIVGKNGAMVEYDPVKIRDVEFDMAITESTQTPVYRQMANDILLQLWQAQAISIEQLLEEGDFPFADSLLQSIRTAREQAEANNQAPAADNPQMQQIAQAAPQGNPQAMAALDRALRGPQNPIVK